MGDSAQPSLQDIFDAMNAAVEADGSLKKKFGALVRFNVDGEICTLDARSGSASHQSSSDGATPDLDVKTSFPVLLDLIHKKVKPQEAFMKGKLKIKGKMALAMKLNRVLEATRKHLALQNSRL